MSPRTPDRGLRVQPDPDRFDPSDPRAGWGLRFRAILEAELAAGATHFGDEDGHYWAVTKDGRRRVVPGTAGWLPDPVPLPAGPGLHRLAAAARAAEQAAERGPPPEELAAAPRLAGPWRLALDEGTGALRVASAADADDGVSEGDVPAASARLLGLAPGPDPLWTRTADGWLRLPPGGFRPRRAGDGGELDLARRVLAATRGALLAAAGGDGSPEAAPRRS